MLRNLRCRCWIRIRLRRRVWLLGGRCGGWSGTVRWPRILGRSRIHLRRLLVLRSLWLLVLRLLRLLLRVMLVICRHRVRIGVGLRLRRLLSRVVLLMTGILRWRLLASILGRLLLLVGGPLLLLRVVRCVIVARRVIRLLLRVLGLRLAVRLRR